MKSLHVAPGLALLVSTITTATMLTTALPATADTGHDGRPGASAGAARPLGRSALASLRDRQARLAARPAPVFDLAASRTFTVTTTEDASLATPTDTHCVDGISGKCSLRAAVEAADNLATPVRIVLRAHTYALTTLTELTVTDPAGISVVGQGAGRTAIAGDGSGLLTVGPTAVGFAPGQLFLTSLKLTNGRASDGGAVHLARGAALALDHVVATRNVATDAGGAIYADESNSVFVSHSTLTHNRAIIGGALYAFWGDLQITSSTLAGNSTPSGSDGAGGAIINKYGVVHVRGGSISGNTAGAPSHTGSGGAIDDTFGKLTLSAVHLDHNTAINGVGGAINAYGDLVEVDRGTLSHDSVTGPGGQGGAIYGDAGARLELHRVAFAADTVGSATGAGEGGAIAVRNGATIGDTGSTFVQNRALGDGASGGAVLNASNQSGRFVGSRFTGNRAGPATGGNGFGGAVFTSDSAGTVFAKVTMSGNVAASDGGAVYGDISEYATSVDASTFSGNRAGSSSTPGAGGAVYLSNAVLSVENSTFTGNSAASTTGLPGQGGAIWHGGSRLGLHYSTVSGNFAQEGGGVYTQSSGGDVLASILSGNRVSPTGAEQDCAVLIGFFPLDSLGGNVLGRAGCVTGLQSSDVVSRRLHLARLRDNGGPTRTMAITANSPAVGRASYLVPATDQRGHRRPTRHADAGAFELPAR